MACTYAITEEHSRRMRKKATISPSQPWRLFHPPALRLPRQPLHPGTCLVPDKAAANYHFIRDGWDDPNCARYFSHPALCAPRRALSQARVFQFSLPLFRGVAKAALNCAHRTSTVSSCAFCEQGGHLAAPYPSFSSHALREHGDRLSYPTSFSASCYCFHPDSTQRCAISGVKLPTSSETLVMTSSASP